jgi:hypothetical protein
VTLKALKADAILKRWLIIEMLDMYVKSVFSVTQAIELAFVN